MVLRDSWFIRFHSSRSTISVGKELSLNHLTDSCGSSVGDGMTLDDLTDPSVSSVGDGLTLGDLAEVWRRIRLVWFKWFWFDLQTSRGIYGAVIMAFSVCLFLCSHRMVIGIKDLMRPSSLRKRSLEQMRACSSNRIVYIYIHREQYPELAPDRIDYSNHRQEEA